MEDYETTTVSSSTLEEKKKQAFKRKQILEARWLRLTLLAKPHPRKLIPSPDPRFFYKGFKPITQASLIYRPTKRIKLLSQLPNYKRREKYVKPEPPEHIVRPESLLYVPTQRILELAQIESQTKIPEKPPKKKKIDLKARREMIRNHAAWIELRSKPKPIPQPPPLETIKPAYQLTPEQKEEKIKKLAQPRHIHEPYKEPPIVSPAALKYVPSKRILELSGPKELDPETVLTMNYNPLKIKWSALHYKATDRIKEMALPNVRKKKDDSDLKENPFSVNPRALKAICNKRCKELAQPIERG